MKQVYLLTSNPIKIAAANLSFNKFDIEVLPLKLNIPEIQADTSQEVASYCAKEAFAQTRKPVIREDHSFFIDALGIPGPYMAYMEQKVNAEQILKLLDILQNRNGHFELAAAYVDIDGELHEFSYQVPVEFSKEPKGDPSLKWDRIFKFPYEERVFAEYPEAERSSVWAKNFEKVAQLIASDN